MFIMILKYLRKKFLLFPFKWYTDLSVTIYTVKTQNSLFCYTQSNFVYVCSKTFREKLKTAFSNKTCVFNVSTARVWPNEWDNILMWPFLCFFSDHWLFWRSEEEILNKDDENLKYKWSIQTHGNTGIKP